MIRRALTLLLVLAVQAPAQNRPHEDIRYMLARAERLMSQLNYRFAIEHLERTEKRHPEDPRVPILAGECRFALDEYEAAIADYRRGLAMAPELAARVPNYPFALFKLDRLDEAEEAYRALLEAAAEDAERSQGHYGLGLVALNRGRVEAARESFAAAFAANPASEKVNYRLGLLLRNEGRLDEAITHLERVVASDGLHEAALHNLALAHAGKRDREKARAWRTRHLEARAARDRLEALKVALHRSPGDVDVLTAIAKIYADHGCWSDARGPWSAVTAARPEDPEPRYMHALCLYHAGEWLKARQQLEQVLRAHPDHEDAARLHATLVEQVHGADGGRAGSGDAADTARPETRPQDGDATR